MENYVEQLDVLLHITFAMILGGIVGFEREREDKPAGMRTHMLVAGATTGFVLLAAILVAQFPLQNNVAVQADPIRTIEAVVAGITFLGAGTIMRRETGAVEGLTTAASLLFVSIIALAVALDQFVLAVGFVLLALVTLRLAKRLLEESGTKSAD